MIKLTVKEYATRLQLTTQYVYKQVATNKVKSVKENGTRYILTTEKYIASRLQTDYKQSIDKVITKSIDKDITSVASEGCQSMVEYLQEELKKTLKENKRLTKKLEKSSASKEKVLLQYIEEMKQLRIAPAPVASVAVDEDVIDIKEQKKRKNKKKRKKNK